MIEQVQAEIKTALKGGEKAKLETLRMLLADLKKEAIDSKSELTEETSIKIVKRAIKRRKESIEQFRAGNRQDLVEKEEAGLKVLEAFAPKELSAEEAEKIVDQVIAETGAQSKQETGKVMKAIMSQYGGQIDGKTVQQLVASKLS